MSKYFWLSLSLITFIFGLGLGTIVSPNYAAMARTETDSMDLGKADQDLDRRYLNGLIAHHLTAIDLAQQVVDTSHRREIRDLAHDIIRADQQSIEELYRWKNDWYEDTQKIQTYSQINLGAYDDNFDLRFLNALTAHHQEAIVTNRDVLTKSTRPQILTLAGNSNLSLAQNLETFKLWRSSWYQL